MQEETSHRLNLNDYLIVLYYDILLHFDVKTTALF